MTIEAFAAEQRVSVDDLRQIAAYVTSRMSIQKEDRVSLIRDLVLDDQIEGYRSEIAAHLKEVTSSKLFEQYYSNWGKYRRSSIKTVAVTNTFDTIRYFNSLIMDVDKLVYYKEVPETIITDIEDFKSMITKTMQVCIMNDGVIDTEEFDTFFGIMYGIYEGIQSFLGKLKDKAIDSAFLRFFRDQTKDKAFRSTILSSRDSQDILKGLFSLGTHLVITSQMHPEFKPACDYLISQNLGIMQEYSRTGDLSVVERVVF